MKSHLLLADHTTKAYQYLGYLSNDERLTNNVAEMVKAGMDVNCRSVEKEPSRYDILISGFKWDENLYTRLLNELAAVTGKPTVGW